MKKLLFGLLMLGSVSSYATTCYVSGSSANNSEFDVSLATYDNVQERESIITIIKENGEVLRDLDFSAYYEGAQTSEEIEARSAELENSKMAIIYVDKTEESLNLSTGKMVKIGEETKSSVIALSGLNSKKSAVFDMENGLSILCMGN